MSPYWKDGIEFERVGLGYVGTSKANAIVMRLDRIKGKDELHGTLTVERAPEGTLTKSRFNVSSATTRKSMAGYLRDRSNHVDWVDILEEFCVKVMQAEDGGEADFEDVGQLPASERKGWLMPPFLHLDEPTILFADGASGKSLLALAIAISVTTGRAVIPGITPRVTGPVIYLDWETDHTEVDRRVKAICAGAGIDPVTLVYRRCSRPLPEIVDLVARKKDEVEGVLTVVDSTEMASDHQGDDSANSSAIRHFKALRDIGGASLSIDHVSKQGGNRAGPYGSTFKRNIARSAWSITTLASDDSGSHIELYHDKPSSSARQPKVHLSVGWSSDDSAVTFRQEAAPIRDQPDGDTVLDRLTVALMDGPLRPKEVALRLGVSPNYASTMLGRGIERGLYRKTEDGRYGLRD